ncbi:gluconokinase [Actinoplanes sp. NPDC051851]|uniref:gluconokinase n=1 Tax=Actinoplanes sp. NPDC051851 TaxID=3154753 RepID=UPI003426EE6F
MDVVIGIDTGTTATKGIAAGPGGEVRAQVSVHYPLSVPGPGRAELDPEHLIAAAVKALTDVAARCRERGDRVIAIGLSAFLHGLVPMDGDGRPLGPLVTWADGRAAEQCERIVASGRARGLQARTGTPVHPMSPLAKLTWWNENDPETLRGTPRWGGVKELIVAALAGGPFRVDLSLASGMGLYDIHGRGWDDEALQLAGVRHRQLAEVVATTERLALRPEVASAAGIGGSVPLIIGAADGPLANLGVGAVPPGVAAVSLGTSGALRTVVDRPAGAEDGRLFCYALTEKHWVVGGAVNNAGSVVRWAGEAFAAGFERPGADGEDADERDAALLEEAAGIAAGSEGLICLPYLLGERAPWWRPGLRGAYLGLRREHRRPHLVRAAVEGVCQQLALVRDSFTTPVTEVRATGGAVASRLWVEVLAAALDLPVSIADTPEGTALGACLLARHALGELPDLDQAASLTAVGSSVTPRAEDAALYRRMRPLVERSALAVLDVVAELDRLAPKPLPATEKAVPGSSHTGGPR